MYKKLLLATLLLSSLVMTSGCSKREPLAITVSQWPGYKFISMAKSEGWLDGYNIEIVEAASATEMLQALKEGRVAGAALTLDEVLRAREAGLPLQVILVFDESVGGDLVIGRKPMKNLAELKGMRIGVETGAVGALMLYKTLDMAGLTEADVTVVDMPIDQHLDYWQRGDVDAVVTYQPIANRIISQGGVRLFDSRDVPNLIIDVLAIRSDIATAHRDQLRHLTAMHFRALHEMRISPQDAAYRIAAPLNLTGDDVLMIFRGMEIPDVSANRHFLQEGGRLKDSAEELSRIMLKHHLLSQGADLKGIVTTDYLGEQR